MRIEVSQAHYITAMASARMFEEFFEAVAHHLSPEQPVRPKELPDECLNYMRHCGYNATAH